MEVEPAGHGVHGSGDDGSAENVPGAQGVHTGEPTTTAFVPEGHDRQLCSEVAPGEVDAVPVGHAMHAVEEVAKGATARPRNA